MDKATVRGRRLLSGGTLVMLFAASVALLAIFSYAPEGSPPTAPASVIASVGLIDDDGGQALFPEQVVVPGIPVSRCLKVRYSGPTPTDPVYLSATTDTQEPLSGYLDLRIEQGAGGDFDTCAGFAAQHPPVHDGTLAELVDAEPATPQTSTDWIPADGQSRTFRFTVTLRDVAAAQNRTSTATFNWFIPGGGPVATSPTPAATTPPTTAAPDDPAANPAPSTPAPRTSAVPADPQASADPVPGQREPDASGQPELATAGPHGPDRDGGPLIVPVPPGAPDADGQAAPSGPKGRMAQIKERLAELVREIAEVAVRTSSHGALPVTALAVLVAFLAMQNRFDRLDPKLALAPMKDPLLLFVDPDDDDPAVADPVTLPPGEGVP